MIDIRVRKIERYEVTRYRETENGGSCDTVATDLTRSQADDIAGAVYERSKSAGKVASASYSPSAYSRDEWIDKAYITLIDLGIEPGKETRDWAEVCYQQDKDEESRPGGFAMRDPEEAVKEELMAAADS